MTQDTWLSALVSFGNKAVSSEEQRWSDPVTSGDTENAIIQAEMGMK